MSIEIPPHRLIYASVALTRWVMCVLQTLDCATASTPQTGYLRVSTITLFPIELLEDLGSENMEQLLKERFKN